MSTLGTSANGGGGVWQRWHVYVALGSLVFTLLGFIARIVTADASIDTRLSRMEYDVKQVQSDYARKDVIEQRLLNIENTVKRIEESEGRQSLKLDNILMQQRGGTGRQ
jgi:hypothetical protein